MFPYLVLGLGLPIAGIIIAFKNTEWEISLFGYGMVVAGLGAICGPTVNMYESGVVINALLATCGMTILMSVIGIITPRSLEHWGGYLLGILSVVLLVSIARIFFPASADPLSADASSQAIVAHYIWLVFDYLVAILFCVYIIYDWNRALRLPRTLDNAVDCSVAIFLDVVNLFVRLLLASRSRK